jgi:PTH1 family peptidyl-tRNA hydrolase
LRVVLGLGNPGSSYAATRHNVGFWVLDRLAERHGLRFGKKEYRSQVARGELEGERVVMLKPQTYMNASGEAAQRIRRDLGLEPTAFVAVYDDLDLPLGRVRVRRDGTAGGHRGVQSLIDCLGSQDFARVRVGIGRAGDAVDYVLDRPTEAEATVLREAVERAADAVETVLRDGVAAAMNRFNGPPG